MLPLPVWLLVVPTGKLSTELVGALFCVATVSCRGAGLLRADLKKKEGLFLRIMRVEELFGGF